MKHRRGNLQISSGLASSKIDPRALDIKFDFSSVPPLSEERRAELDRQRAAEPADSPRGYLRPRPAR